MFKFKKWFIGEEQINISDISNGTGSGQAIDCMQKNGANIIGIYDLLDSEKDYGNTIFLGLDENNKLYDVMVDMVGGMRWDDGSALLGVGAIDADRYMEAIINSKYELAFFIPTKIAGKHGYTINEFNWLANNCRNKKAMKKVTIVVGLHNIVSDKELQKALRQSNGGVIVGVLKDLLTNWRQHISDSPPTPGFTTKRLQDFVIEKVAGKIVSKKSYSFHIDRLPYYIDQDQSAETNGLLTCKTLDERYWKNQSSRGIEPLLNAKILYSFVGHVDDGMLTNVEKLKSELAKIGITNAEVW